MTSSLLSQKVFKEEDQAVSLSVMPPKKQKEVCGKCEAVIKQKETSLNCSTCKIPFHTKCYQISDAKYQLLTENEDLLWFCKSCRAVTANLVGKLVILERRCEDIESENTKLRNDLSVTQNLVKSLHEKNKELEDKLGGTIEINKRNHEKIQNQMERKKEKIQNMMLKIDSIEQDMNSKSVRITGYTKSPFRSLDERSALTRVAPGLTSAMTPAGPSKLRADRVAPPLATCLQVLHVNIHFLTWRR